MAFEIDPPRLETARLVVEVPAASRAPAMAVYQRRNVEHFARWVPPRPAGFDTTAFWERRFELYRDEARIGRAARFVLSPHEAPDEIIGTCALSDVSLGPFRGCLLGYGLDAGYEGRGIMSEAVRAVVGYAFGALALHRVMANYMPSNERSGALLKKLGFVVEGYARDYLFIDGKFRDHILTALTNHELENAAELCSM